MEAVKIIIESELMEFGFVHYASFDSLDEANRNAQLLDNGHYNTVLISCNGEISLFFRVAETKQ